jgi:hypothetical protein
MSECAECFLDIFANAVLNLSVSPVEAIGFHYVLSMPTVGRFLSGWDYRRATTVNAA